MREHDRAESTVRTYGSHADNAECLPGQLHAQGPAQAALLEGGVLLAHPLGQHQQRHQR